MKILLLQPLVPSNILWGKFAKGEGFVPPIGLLSISAFLRERGFDVKIKDAQLEKMTEVDLCNYLKDNKFDVVGIPTFTNSITFSYYTAEICRKALPDCKIIFGGFHASTLPEKTLRECKEIDYIVLSEGEYRMEALLKYFERKITNLDEIDGLAYRKNGKIIIQPVINFIKDIDKLPMPAYDLIDMSKYVPHPTQYKVLPNYPLIIQRGCPYNCAFCGAHTVHGRRVRTKSVENVIKELKVLKKQYGARGVYFMDSTFLINRR